MTPTLHEAVRRAADSLKTVTEAPLFEAYELVRAATGADRHRVMLRPDEPVSEEDSGRINAFVSRRLSGEPLQYILGEWDFMGMTFAVGRGVLCPRPETEGLVSAVLGELDGRAGAAVLDLCAGSGCIGISVASLRPDARVTLFEKSPDALGYLRRNLSLCRGANVVEGDIFSGFERYNIEVPDIIVSNPPYIASAEIDTLQREVLCEPREALDGGADGLDFYRAIAEKWQPFIKPGGLLAVECGEGQTGEISRIFSAGASSVSVGRDCYGVERFVLARV